MYTLLNWLWTRAERVYEFFGTLYYRIRDAALNAYYWAINEGSKAFTRAYDWILYWYNRAKDGAKALVDGVALLANVLYNRALESAVGLFNNAIIIAAYYFDRAVTAAQGLVNGVSALAWTLYYRAVAAAQAIGDGIESIFKALLQQAETRLNNLINGADARTAKLKTTLGLDDPAKTQALMTFINNPLGWFAGYLKDVLLVMLEWGLAYSLGTTEGTLPPWPDFMAPGKGGPLPDIPGPPPGSGPIGPPLHVLWLSGYPFRYGHLGADFGGALGTPVYACHAGQVVSAGWSNIGYGNYVVLDGGEWWSLYGHLSQIMVAQGQRVKLGEAVGLMGCTGNSTCAHLHIEVKHFGQYLDPVLLFSGGG